MHMWVLQVCKHRYNYRSVPSTCKHPWALGIHEPKSRGTLSTDKPFFEHTCTMYKCTVISRLSTHGRLKFTAKKRGWALTQRSHLYIIITHIHTDHRIIKKRGWALTRRWALTRENTVHANHRIITNGGWALTRDNKVCSEIHHAHSQKC